MHPIDVSDRLPEKTQQINKDGCISDRVLVYDADYGLWLSGVYGASSSRDDDYWVADITGADGYECEAQILTHVTHWMPYPPAPGIE